MTPRIVLAPMEGVIDAAMRRRLTAIGGYCRAVTEFVRVTDVRLPERVFLRLCPELEAAGLTPSGVPVYVQLLGSDPAAMAANARRVVDMGAPGVDLNFGCPVKTVNNSMGGSILLRKPERVRELVDAVVQVVAGDAPVTVKIRLGHESPALFESVVAGVRAAGADELAIHARTRADGYRPPAHWHLVACVMSEPFLDTTFINGEIWTPEDATRALASSGCRHLMLGRGALAAPDLALRVHAGGALPAMQWEAVKRHVREQFHQSDSGSPRHVGNRTKQWLAYLKRHYPEAAELFSRIRTLHDIASIDAAFDVPAGVSSDAPAARAADADLNAPTNVTRNVAQGMQPSAAS
ncbi:MAG: tRNA dihydrouridine(16) synthase DusC [Gammaproteobacteria bacterium]|nr:MAG: tRNA dihydrouridine(16) synthase DusC [Gammaproteobacteria bacterium]